MAVTWLGAWTRHIKFNDMHIAKRRMGTGKMTIRSISTFTIDLAAVAAAVVLAAPFIAVMITPFLGGL
jgi:hypothetical protein